MKEEQVVNISIESLKDTKRLVEDNVEESKFLEFNTRLLET